MIGQLGDVDQALDAGQDLHECAEGNDLRDLAVQHVTRLVALDHPLPGVLLSLLEAEADPLTVAVDVQHLDSHGVADPDHFGRMVDVAPREL
jgi:hypothetical protein